MMRYITRPKYFMGVHFSKRYLKAAVLSYHQQQISLKELIKTPADENNPLSELKKFLKQKRYPSGIMLADHQVQFRTMLVNENLIEKEKEVFFKLQLENEFQNINEKLSWDYFEKINVKNEIEYRVAITKEKIIEKYQASFHKAKIPLKKIDVESYALRAFLNDYIKDFPTTLIVIIDLCRISIYVMSENDVHYQQTKIIENAITEDALFHTINQSLNLFQSSEKSTVITHKLIMISDDVAKDMILQLDNQVQFEALNISLQNLMPYQNDKNMFSEVNNDWCLPIAIAYQGVMDEVI